MFETQAERSALYQASQNRRLAELRNALDLQRGYCATVRHEVRRRQEQPRRTSLAGKLTPQGNLQNTLASAERMLAEIEREYRRSYLLAHEVRQNRAVLLGRVPHFPDTILRTLKVVLRFASGESVADLPVEESGFFSLSIEAGSGVPSPESTALDFPVSRLALPNQSATSLLVEVLDERGEVLLRRTEPVSLAAGQLRYLDLNSPEPGASSSQEAPHGS